MAEKNFVLHSNSIALPAPMMAGSSDPVDARYIVKTKANLTAGASTWNTSGNYALIHIGMTVYVADEKHSICMLDQRMHKMVYYCLKHKN